MRAIGLKLALGGFLIAIALLTSLAIGNWLIRWTLAREAYADERGQGQQTRLGSPSVYVAMLTPNTSGSIAQRLHLQAFNQQIDFGYEQSHSGELTLTGGLAVWQLSFWDGLILDPNAQAVVRLSDFEVLYYW